MFQSKNKRITDSFIKKAVREKDIEYYSLIEGVLDAFGDSYGLLFAKIKEQISLNKNISRTRNKTAEELFGGWDAE